MIVKVLHVYEFYWLTLFNKPWNSFTDQQFYKHTRTYACTHTHTHTHTFSMNRGVTVTQKKHHMAPIDSNIQGHTRSSSDVTYHFNVTTSFKHVKFQIN